MNVEDWLNIGLENRWIVPFCAAHDPIPINDEEKNMLDSNPEETCLPVLRLVVDLDE